MDDRRAPELSGTFFPIVGFVLILAVLCVLGTEIFTFGTTHSPKAYAEATMISAATATALPFKATEMAEDLRFQQTLNATTEQAYEETVTGMVTTAKVFLGAVGILAVVWTLAASFKAGAVAVQSAKQAALPGWVDLDDGYRLLSDGAQVRLLDVRTGVSHPLAENGHVLPERAEIAKTEILAQAMVDIAEKTKNAAPADWLGPAIFEGEARSVNDLKRRKP
jgi:hypothetical protein